MRGLNWLIRLIYPPKCLLCERLLGKYELDLCRNCRIHGPEQPAAKNKHPYLDSWLALWYYENDVRRSLLRYKFRGRQNRAKGYGRLLAMRILRERDGQFDLIAWVPISGLRRFRRGYDQVELLAEAVSGELGIPAVSMLKKVRHNRRQSGIRDAATRKANVLGVYRTVQPEYIRGRRLLLLDDILTTGSTASECARMLKSAGAEEVHCAAIAASRK